MADESVRRRRTILDRLAPTRDKEGVQHESSAASLDLAVPRRGAEQPQFAVPPVNVQPKQGQPLLFEDLLIPARMEDDFHLRSKDQRISFRLSVAVKYGSTSAIHLGVKADEEADQVYVMKKIFVTPGPNPKPGFTRNNADANSGMPLYTLHPDDIANEVNNMIKAKSRLAPHFVVALNDDMGQLERIFIAMPVMQGTALDVIKRLEAKGRSDLLRVHFTSRLLQQISGDLHQAHANGIAMGEIKLENVFINLDGTMVQGDYGGSIDIRSQAKVALVDTPYFRPPKAAGTSALSDLFEDNIFQMGAMLTESFLEKSPFLSSFWADRAMAAGGNGREKSRPREDASQVDHQAFFREHWVSEGDGVALELSLGKKTPTLSKIKSSYVRDFLEGLFSHKEGHALSRLIVRMLAPSSQLRPKAEHLRLAAVKVAEELDRPDGSYRAKESVALDKIVRQLATEVGEVQATDVAVTTELERERFMGRLHHDNPNAAADIGHSGGLQVEPLLSNRLSFGPSKPLIARRNSTGSSMKPMYIRAQDQEEAVELIEEMSQQFLGLDLASSTTSKRISSSSSQNNISDGDDSEDEEK